jgi:predicted nucleic acid-binding Zn ribbon protein
VKLQLKGARFDTIEGIQNAMKKLETRANLCNTSNGSCFEKKNKKNIRLLFFLVFIALVREFWTALCRYKQTFTELTVKLVSNENWES